jgi:ribosome biogenesis SPOUT family RNA methylase Rps3
MFAPILIDTTRTMKSRTEIEERIAELEARREKLVLGQKQMSFDDIKRLTFLIKELKWVLS